MMRLVERRALLGAHDTSRSYSNEGSTNTSIRCSSNTKASSSIRKSGSATFMCASVQSSCGACAQTRCCEGALSSWTTTWSVSISGQVAEHILERAQHIPAGALLVEACLVPIRLRRLAHACSDKTISFQMSSVRTREIPEWQSGELGALHEVVTEPEKHPEIVFLVFKTYEWLHANKLF
eukprot:5464844-Amphidinium_carterae.1